MIDNVGQIENAAVGLPHSDEEPLRPDGDVSIGSNRERTFGERVLTSGDRACCRRRRRLRSVVARGCKEREREDHGQEQQEAFHGRPR